MDTIYDDADQAMHEIELDRQRIAEGVAKRIETGRSTADDAIWLREEFGIQQKRKG